MICVATSKKTGLQCRAKAIRNSNLYYFHNNEPEHVKLRNEASRKKKPRIKYTFERLTCDSVKDIPSIIIRLLNDTLQDKIPPQKVTALDKLLNTLVKAFEAGEMQADINEILEMIEKQGLAE